MPAPEEIGISSTLTKDRNFDGKFFGSKEDFVVQEIELDGKTLGIGKDGQEDAEPSERKDFLTATLVKEGLSTHEALDIIAKENHLSLTRLGYLGNKDRNAVTSQRISIFKISPERLKKDYQRMFLKDFAYSSTGCKIGALKGNHFTLRIRDFNGFDRLGGLIEDAKKGLPNFYGPQHFGASALNIRISEAIIKKDFKGAVSKFIFEKRDESEIFAVSRSRLKDIFYANVDEDVDKNSAENALAGTPAFLKMEKKMLHHLLENKHDYIGALRLVPKPLRLLIVQSFQAYVFNLTISDLISKGELPDELPTLGYDMKNDMVMKIAETNGIKDLQALEIKEMPEASLKSFTRPARIYPKNIEYHRDDNDLVISFELDKGEYATVFLFEMFKHF